MAHMKSLLTTALVAVLAVMAVKLLARFVKPLSFLGSLV